MKLINEVSQSANYKARKINEEIENIFKRARSKLDEIDINTHKEKRQVVRELALELEGKIPLDTICIEIVTQLQGKVSERFVRRCLDSKYKQDYRTVNAKRQTERNMILAALVPLNNTLTSNEGSIDTPSVAADDLKIEEIPGVECPKCRKLRNELALEKLEKSELAYALSKATKIVSAADMLELESESSRNPLVEKVRNIKFCVVLSELRKQMETPVSLVGYTEKMQFAIDVNIQTFEPLSVSVTKPNEHDEIQVIRLLGANNLR